MEEITKILRSFVYALYDTLWGPPMIILFIATGLYFTIRSGFFQLIHIRLWLKNTVGTLFQSKKIRKVKDKNSISQFQSVATALAGALGTGNIAGVATALAAGGPGAIFWMWVSAVLGMMTTFVENVLGIHYRYRDKRGKWIGGPMVYMERGLGLKWIAVWFAVCCLCSSLGMGNISQANVISDVALSWLGISPVISGAALCLIVGLVLLGGLKRIAKVSEGLIPFITIFFLAISLVIIIMNIKALPSAIKSIITDAFSFSAAGGGLAGYFTSRAVRYGIARGVYSNEAGLGSSVLAHSEAEVPTPVTQGMWAVFEVFLDTIVMCTMTALCILQTGVLSTGLNGATLTLAAFEQTFGPVGLALTSVSTLLFAFSSMICWAYYGERCLTYLTGGKFVTFYRIIFIGLIYVGCQMQLTLVWDLADIFNGLMAIPNIIALIILGGKALNITKNYLRSGQ